MILCRQVKIITFGIWSHGTFFKIGFFMYFEMCLKCVCGLVCVWRKLWVCGAVCCTKLNSNSYLYKLYEHLKLITSILNPSGCGALELLI